MAPRRLRGTGSLPSWMLSWMRSSCAAGSGALRRSGMTVEPREWSAGPEVIYRGLAFARSAGRAVDLLGPLCRPVPM